MDPGILVPPRGYGGIERLVDIFAREYTRIGHEVHLLVTTGSYVPGCIMHPFGKEGFPPAKKDALKAIPTAWKFLWKNRKHFDLIHNFGRLAYLLPILNSSVKKIMTYEREITVRNIEYVNRLPNKNLFFTGCSEDLVRRANPPGNWHAVHNAIPFELYTLKAYAGDDAPLMFLGRIERIKGCHTAIEIAKQTGNRLIIAGNISTLPEEIEYYEKEIKPLIDGDKIQYIGTVNDDQKNLCLGNSKAMLFPIEWNEPFGIVMIESMSCGTPVIAFESGSVGEVIDDGITGFKVKTKNEMIAAVRRLSEISRETCRLHAYSRFDVSKIASQYLDLITSHDQPA